MKRCSASLIVREAQKPQVDTTSHPSVWLLTVSKTKKLYWNDKRYTVLKYPNILNIFKVENFLRLTMYLAKDNFQIKDSPPLKSDYNHCIVLSGNPCWRPKDFKGTEGKRH